MALLAGWLVKAVGFFSSSAVTNIMNAGFQWYSKSKDDKLAGFQTSVGADQAAYQAQLQALVEIAQLKAQSAWWGSKAIGFLVGMASAVHYAAVCLISTVPTLGYVVNKLPAPMDTYEWVILQSFILSLGASGLKSTVDRWLSK